MGNRRYPLLILSFVLISLFWIWGCEKNTTAPINFVEETEPTIDDYFPLTTGKTTVIISTNTQYEPDLVISEEFKVGQSVTQYDNSVYAWTHKNLAYPYVVDTSYFYRSGNTLYFYETADSDPEVILDEPLEVGRSWDRYAGFNLIENNLFHSILDSLQIKMSGIGDVSDDDKGISLDSLFGIGGKAFPTTGSSLMTIVAIEDIALKNGVVYKECVKIKNESGTYSNYYWYAPNKGLIKYVLGANEDNLATAEAPEGIVVGELGAAGGLYSY